MKWWLNSVTRKNSKYTIRQNNKQIHLINILSTNLQTILFTDLHFNITTISSPTMTVIEWKSTTALPPHHKASFFTALQHFLSSIGPQNHCFHWHQLCWPPHFNWFSQLQLVFAASTSSTSTSLCRLNFFNFNWSSLTPLLELSSPCQLLQSGLLWVN